jgi:hypothetical protein
MQKSITNEVMKLLLKFCCIFVQGYSVPIQPVTQVTSNSVRLSHMHVRYSVLFQGSTGRFSCGSIPTSSRPRQDPRFHYNKKIYWLATIINYRELGWCGGDGSDEPVGDNVCNFTFGTIRRVLQLGYSLLTTSFSL